MPGLGVCGRSGGFQNTPQLAPGEHRTVGGSQRTPGHTSARGVGLTWLTTGPARVGGGARRYGFFGTSVFRLFITERKGNIHWNVPSRVEASKAALKQLPACHATRGKTEEPYDPQRTTT